MSEVLVFSSVKRKRKAQQKLLWLYIKLSDHMKYLGIFRSLISALKTTDKCQLVYTGCFDSVTLKAPRWSIRFVMKLKNSVNNVRH